MVNRPGFSIRRLISHRTQPQQVPERREDVSYFDDSSSSHTVIKIRDRSSSWVPPTKRKGSTKAVVPRRGHSIHRATNPPQPRSRLAQSPSSSIHSHEGRPSTSPMVPSPRSVRSGHSSEQGRATSNPSTPRRPPRPEELFRPGETNILGEKVPSPTFSAKPDPGRAALRPARAPLHGEAISLYNQPPEDLSDNVQQLIRETDEAFKAVGSALAEAKLASRGFESFQGYAASSQAARRYKPLPLPAGSLREQRPRDMPLPSPLASPTRHASVKKSKKKGKSPKTRPVAARQGTAQAKAPRWTLSENVTEILTGQRFKRIEADEMLTPDQLAELKQLREKAQSDENLLKPRTSDDSERCYSSGAETPVEPFHLQDLALRISASAAKTTRTLVEPSPPSIPLGRDVVHKDFSMAKGEPTESKQGKGVATQSLDKFPTPPPKNPARFSPPQLSQEQQSTIPEVMVTTPDETHLQPSTHRPSVDDSSFDMEETDECFLLKSTPFTLTRPGFRHGPIAISKTDTVPTPATIDDTLDWTAFQMAILGGAGDLSPDMSAAEDAKQTEELADWFDSFGFETYGRLIGEEPPSSRGSSRSGLSSTPSTIDTDVEPPIPVSSEYPSGFWNITTARQSIDALRFYSSNGLKRWTAEGGPKRYTSQSMDSLPPSPMMPLFAEIGVLDDDGNKEKVPMGYNLGHDLGDFLKWEAEHAYGGGIYGSS